MQNLINRLILLIDYFVHESFRENESMVFKVRLLVACLLYFVIGVIAFAPYYVMIENVVDAAEYFYYVSAVPAIITWSAMLFFLKKGKGFNVIAHSNIFVIVIMFYAGICVTGGPTQTEMLPLIVLPVVLSFLMLGQKAGIFWAFFVAVINYIFFYLGQNGYEFLNFPPEEARDALRVFNWSISFISILAIIVIYESTNQRLTEERNRERDKFAHMALHDSLTGLPNRKYFDEQLNILTGLADRTKTKVAVGLLDLNKFKPINDNIGHEAGDIVLQVVSRRLTEILRRSDHVARIGGDEFGFIITNVHEKENIARTAEKIFEAIEESIDLSAFGVGDMSISGSLGFAIFPDDATDLDKLKIFSDQAMYEAKNAGVKVAFYQPPEQA